MSIGGLARHLHTVYFGEDQTRERREWNAAVSITSWPSLLYGV